jgi:predicted metalloprotease with PDZ domain
VQTLFAAPPQWVNWRRSADYYPEGYLIWLDVDTTLRRQSNGQKSLNDFCKIFFGGPSGAPNVIPYKFEDLVATLNQVVAYDWAKFLRERLDSKSAHAPLGGIENGGWKLVYTDQKNTTLDAAEKSGGAMDLSSSIGVVVTKDGELRDVVPGTPAFASGLGPGMKIIAVNGRKFSKDVMHAALRAGIKSQQPLAFLAENGEYFNTYQVDYHGGDKYPHLVRVEGQADLLGDITKPMTK